MPAEVTPLSSKATSCFTWSVEQMLEDALAEIRSGKLTPKGAVITFAIEEAGRIRVHSWRAQLSWTEEFTYLHIARESAVDGRRG